MAWRGVARRANPRLNFRRTYLLSLACAAGLTAAGLLAWPRLALRLGVRPAPARVVERAPRWPEDGARLSAEGLALPAEAGVRRVYLDAGHGAPKNRGNTSCFCVAEEEFTQRAARALADRLEATGAFEVRISREGDRLVDYRERVSDAEAWGADVFVSLHSDVRGKPERWTPRPDVVQAAAVAGEGEGEGGKCPVSLAAPGFSVLWSDEGAPDLAARRLSVARAVARRMEEAGFLAYSGAEYTGLYEGDAAQRGVFVDRHAPDQRIFVLRRPSLPSVLVETHHALDPREASRWELPETLDAFAAALGAALAEALEPSPSASMQDLAGSSGDPVGRAGFAPRSPAP